METEPDLVLIYLAQDSQYLMIHQVCQKQVEPVSSVLFIWSLIKVKENTASGDNLQKLSTEHNILIINTVH